MMKYSKILALFAALTFAFALAGCGEDAPETSGIGRAKVAYEWKLSDTLKGLTAAPSAEFTETVAQGLFSGTGLANCGDVTGFTIDKTAGTIAIDTKTINWGAGLDLQDSKFKFAEGDKIVVTGTLVSGNPTQIYINVKPGAEKAYSATPVPTSTAAAFTITRTLDASDIADIKGANPSGVRISAKADGINFKLTEITLEGMR